MFWQRQTAAQTNEKTDTNRLTCNIPGNKSAIQLTFRFHYCILNTANLNPKSVIVKRFVTHFSYQTETDETLKFQCIFYQLRNC